MERAVPTKYSQAMIHNFRLSVISLFIISLSIGSCAALQSGKVDDRLQQIERKMSALSGESKEIVLEGVKELDFKEPVSIREEDGFEIYEFRKEYMSGIGGYDKLVLRFQDDLLYSYDATARR